MKTLRHLPIIILGFALTTACAKNDDGEKAGKSEPPTTAAKSIDIEPPPAAEPEPAALDLRTRLFSCELVGWDGEGEERTAKFAVVNKSDKPITRIQTWIYYYDAEDKQFDRYPHSLFAELAPGVKKELKLGATGDKIDEKTKTAACEITSATWSDDSEWENQNLVYNSFSLPRPLAGQTDEQLIARTGSKVDVTWKGNLDGQGKFTLTNTSGRPLMVKTLWIYYYDKTGKQLDRTVANLRLKLDAGASSEQELGRDKKELKKGTAVIEGGVSEVQFDDGDKWLNRNVAAVKRPMKTAAE